MAEIIDLNTNEMILYRMYRNSIEMFQKDLPEEQKGPIPTLAEFRNWKKELLRKIDDPNFLLH
jgi:hypothetical protein